MDLSEDLMRKNSKVHEKKAKVIPFFKTGEEYFEKALKAYQYKDLYKAKRYLQRASELDRDEPLILYQLATILNDLGEYKESNELLLHIINDLDSTMVNCYYVIANNFAHLGLFQEAYKYVQCYLEEDVTGELLEEAEELEDLLSIDLESDEEYEEDALILKQEQAKQLLQDAQFEKAIQLLEEIIRDYPEFWSAYNNLALAHFYLNETDKAIGLLDEVLEKNPGNLHALCNQLVFHYYGHNQNIVNYLIQQLSCVYPLSLEHQYKLGSTFALVGEYKLAYGWLKSLYKKGFQADSSFHYWLSYAAYHVGFEQFAKDIWKNVSDSGSMVKLEAPWQFNEKNNRRFYSEIDVVAQEKCESTHIHDQLYSLYMAKKLPDKERLLLLEKIKPSIHTSSLLDEVYTYVWQNRQHIMFEIADLIQAEIEAEVEAAGIIQFWFNIYVELNNIQAAEWHHVNVNGWASAATYCYQKQKQQAVSQEKVAQLYSISLSTVRKYVKIVNNLLK